MEYSFKKMKDGLDQLNLKMTEQMEQQFLDYYDVLMEWNQVMNLTSITDFQDVVEKHFLDSIILGSFLKLDHEWKLIDVGTGAGFPGIPLKIMFPKLRLVLADSLNKRIRFLNEVILRLKLDGVSTVHGRAEELAQKKEYRGQFDLAVSRAVANLAVLNEYCLPFVKTGGIFAAYKSGEIEGEVQAAGRAIELLGGKLNSVHKFHLPDTEYERSFVLIDKVENTSKKYPRKAGIPTKQPLGL